MNSCKIGIVMGGYLDENNKLMDRTELNKRISLAQVEIAELKEELRLEREVVEAGRVYFSSLGVSSKICPASESRRLGGVFKELVRTRQSERKEL